MSFHLSWPEKYILGSLGSICLVIGILFFLNRSSSLPMPSRPFVASSTVGMLTNTSSTKSLQVLEVPVFVHFLSQHENKVTGEPTFISHGKEETMADFDKALETFNAKVEEAAGVDTRRLRLVRVGMRVMTNPSLCPDPYTIVAPHRVMNAINILFQTADDCVPVASPSQYVRTDAYSLPHEVGHALGLKHTFFANNVPGQAELLARIVDPSDPTSCYLLGDNVCDTPPDYGYRYLGPDGQVDDSSIVCSMDPFPACIQDGPPCNPNDAIVDNRQTASGTALCVPYQDKQGRRTYDAQALGLVVKHGTYGELLPNNNNIMAYVDNSRFTYEQFVRMHGFTQWRMGQPDQVPPEEQRILRGMESGPDDPFGTVGSPTPIDADWRLASPTAVSSTLMHVSDPLTPKEERVLLDRVKQDE